MDNKLYRFKQFKEQVFEKNSNFSTDAQVNEGILDLFKKAKEFAKGQLKKIKDYFVGKGAWTLNLEQLQKEGKLPKGMKVYPYGNPDFVEVDVEQASPEEIEASKSLFAEYAITENFSKVTESVSKINEAEYVELGAKDMDIPNVNGEDFKKVIEDTFAINNNLLIWGAPGIGKTQIVKEVAKDNKATAIVVILSLMEPVDAIGLPEVDGITTRITDRTGSTDVKKRRTVNRLPLWYPMDNYNANGEEVGGILFLDELNRANPSVMNALLTLVQDREISSAEYKIPSKWVVMAAANREWDDPGNLEEIGTALGNRFKHVNFVPTAEAWIKWGSRKSADGKQNVNNEILAFIEFNGEYLHRLDPEGSPAWPSPRSWAAASSELAEVKARRQKNGNPFTIEDTKRIMASHIGNSFAAEFMEYLKVSQQYPLNMIGLAYTDPTKAPVPNKSSKGGRIDTSLALLAAIAYMRKDDDLTDDEFWNIIEYTGLMDRPELAMNFLKIFFRFHPHFKTEEYMKDKRFSSVIGKYN